MGTDKLSELRARYKSDDEIYHDLMQFKIREILLVATIYDAFILEQEGKLTELIFGEYYQLNLSSAPRVTSVSYGEKALELLEKRRFDMIILTMRIDEMTPFELSKKIRAVKPNIPILLLLNEDNDIELIKDKGDRLQNFDRIFVWNGDAKVFLSMIKYIEDKINVVNDTRIGLVRVVLLVEDSIRYYSRYLPMLHVEIMKQTQRLIADEHLDEVKKLLRMRTRPKVLMAGSYEEAIELFNTYKDYLLCVISDMRFSINSVLEEHAGMKLIQYIKSQTEFLPILLQSAEPENAEIATDVNIGFLNKNSDNLSHDLTAFIINNLGFGDFVFRNQSGEEIARAQTMAEFENLIKTVPDESLVYHADRNHFSSWLMARGEIQIANFIQPIKVSHFDSSNELREHLIEVCKVVHEQKAKGKVILFDETSLEEEKHVIRLSGGSIGGKGRGMAFLNMLIENRELFSVNPDINVMIPQTTIIGTDEYDYFIDKNGFRDTFNNMEDFEDVKKLAITGDLSRELRDKLQKYLRHVDSPLAVRSSSLFEDSISQPFSGIYDTYFLPNNHPDSGVRLKHLEEAIKLVYASVYSRSARSYFEAINYKVGEEKMAVLLQRAVGNQHGQQFYPQLSGVAQSYNYYPISYLEPGDGIAIIGFGLGKYVVDGEKAWRFCPKYPNMDFIAQKDILKDSQVEFYALNMEESDIDLLEGSDATLARYTLDEAEEDESFHYCTSVWDPQDNSIKVGTGYKGPRIMNFAPIIKYNQIPLTQVLDDVLGVVKSSMGLPVEIEFAVDLKKNKNGKPSFYILQIRPLIGNLKDYHLDLEDIDRDDLFLHTDKAMGNGTVDDVYDIIYVDHNTFDRGKTIEMVEELEQLNNTMRGAERKYILIGPGRWGSRDRWLGIPVRWAQISNAKIIVETELEDFHIDASLGSHFFNNVTSNNVGYFYIPYGSNENFIDWEWLRKQRPVNKTGNFIHVRVKKPLIAKMDGRTSVSVIYKEYQ
jgi:CheY-like chemotaxis protein